MNSQAIPFFEVILISLGLSADAFSVALAAGAQGFTLRRVFRLSWHFGLFQFLMPIIGWALGDVLSRFVGSYGPWAVMALLILIGGKMVVEGIRNAPENLSDLSRGWNLVSLSVGTSLDALGVGLGLGLLDARILIPATMIGIVCAAMTTVGLYLGVRLYKQLGHRAVIIGGIILIAIGIKMVV